MTEDDRQPPDERLDRLIRQPMLEVPTGFDERVMAAIRREAGAPRAGPVAARRHGEWRRSRLARWAIVVGGAAACAEAVSFVFGIWMASAAG